MAQPVSDDEEIVYCRLAEELGAKGLASRIDRAVWLTNWRGLGIKAGMVFAAPAQDRPDQWIARADLTFIYNVEAPETGIQTRTIGLGASRAAALEGAVGNWMTGTAPALLSHIDGELKYGADYLPASGRLGISGWDCISGPYLITGNEELKRKATSFLQKTQLLACVRDLLVRELNRQTPYHSVTLYLAMSGETPFADVLVDNREFDAAAELLKAVPIPHDPEPSAFVSLRQFFLCVRPE